MDIRKIIKEVFDDVFNENLITEKLNDIDSDVDLIYGMYFKKTVELINSGNKVSRDDFPTSTTDTSILLNNDCINADSINPCSIIINYGGNYYQPSTSSISLSFNINAVNFLLENGRTVELAINELDDDRKKNSFSKEFSEEKIKGSIHHELLHWIDDTFNNRHISKKLDKAKELGTKDINGIPINSTKLEIQGQMGNIKQLYNKFKNEDNLRYWNGMYFSDLIKLSPSLNLVFNQLSGDTRLKWVRDIKTRMYREGLLGNMMIFDK